MAVASPLESMARRFFEALDSKDFEQIAGFATAHAQAVDEITRNWLRGRVALEAYFRLAAEHVSNIRSTLSDLHAVEIGDVGIVTMILDQEYEIGGQATSVHAPTSMVFRRVEGDWRMVLFHSVPLTERD